MTAHDGPMGELRNAHLGGLPASAPQFVPDLIRPTDQQLAIQTARQNTIIVHANAGAAKTTTLALRMAETWQRGVAPEKILALTFTEPAVEALRAALRKIGVPYAAASRFGIMSFESFASSVLLPLEGAPVPLLSSAEALKPYVWEAIHRVENNPSERFRDELVMPSIGDNAAIDDFLRVATHLKGTMQLDFHEGAITPDYAASVGRDYTALRIFKQYENRVRTGSHPDRPAFRGPFDATYDLANQIRCAAPVNHSARWPSGLRALLLDEMHDLNRAMFLIVVHLLESNPACFFCGAGDRGQVIHQQCGADPRFMQDDVSLGAGRRAARYELTASYRFGEDLARAAGRLMDRPYASNAAHPTLLRIEHCAGDAACAAMIVEEARQWRQAHTLRKMSEFAVLLRHDHQSVMLENKLLEAGISYTTRGLQSYLLRPEVLFVRGLLAVATDDLASVENEATRRRIMEAFFFFCGIAISDDFDTGKPQHRLMAEASQAAAANPRVLNYFFENQVLANAEDGLKRRLAAAVAVARTDKGPAMLGQFMAALGLRSLVASALVERQRQDAAIGNLDGLLQSASRFDDAAAFFRSLNELEKRQEQLKATASIVLSSVEAAKGLEFDHVLVPHLKQGVFPDRHEAPDDETNLFYVAITRAKKVLTLYADTDGPSEFVAKMQ